MSGPPKSNVPAHNPSSLNPLNPPHLNRLPHASSIEAIRLTIKVQDPTDREVPAILHRAKPSAGGPRRNVGAILVSGAGGGVSGPNGIYPSLATKLATHHIPTLRLDYRAPSRTPQCTNDILAGMDWMEREEGVEGVVLVGWSFGSAPTIGVGARERRDGAKGRVRGVANVAPQTAETSGIHDLAPTPVLFLHGTGDACLSPRCSQNLYASYGEYGSREIELYEGDNHGLTNSSAKAERRLFEFITRCLGVSAEEETAQAKLADGEEGVQMMKEGHDLEHGERL